MSSLLKVGDVGTVDGYAARIICTDRLNVLDDSPVVALIKYEKAGSEVLRFFDSEGKGKRSTFVKDRPKRYRGIFVHGAGCWKLEPPSKEITGMLSYLGYLEAEVDDNEDIIKNTVAFHPA